MLKFEKQKNLEYSVFNTEILLGERYIICGPRREDQTILRKSFIDIALLWATQKSKNVDQSRKMMVN